MKIIVVGLPLGKIEDISLRAIRILAEAKIVICEDTRVFHRLWQKLKNQGLLSASFGGRLLVINDFNEAARINWILEQIGLAGEAILVSDAGMPLISDPGYRLLKELLSRGGTVEVVPGPTAAMTALAISGLPADKVLFLGFLPKKSSKKRALWDLIRAAAGLTVVIYESPVRVKKTLEEIGAEFGKQTPTVIARELTKKYEQVLRGTPAELSAAAARIKGEVVILFRYTG